VPTTILLLYRMFTRPTTLGELVVQSARVFLGFVAAVNILLVAVLQRIPFRLTLLDRLFFGLAGLLLVTTLGYPLIRGTRVGEAFRRGFAPLLGLDRIVPTNPLEAEMERLKDLWTAIANGFQFDLEQRAEYLACEAAILTIAERCDLTESQIGRIKRAAQEARVHIDDDPRDPVTASEAATAIGVLASTVEATFREIPSGTAPRARTDPEKS